MKRRTGRVSIFIVTLAVTSLCRASDWNQFRGPYRTGVSPERNLLREWPEGGPAMLWSMGGLGRGFATVSVVDGILYTTGMIDETGYLFAIHDTGQLKWRKPYGPEWAGSYPGTRTTPTIDGDRIYIMSGRGRLACRNREDGELIWQVDTLEKFQGENITWGIAESILIEEDTVFCTPGGKDASIVALNKHTGETIWTSKGLSNLSAYCSPVLMKRKDRSVLMTMVRKLIVGLDSKTGDVLWTIPHETRNDIAAVMPVKFCYYGYFTSHGTGGTMIKLSLDGSEFSEVWTNPALDCLHGGVVMTKRNLYGSDSKGNWICQDFGTGEVKFSETLLDAKGSITCADGMLYCYSEKGTLALVRPDYDAMKLISSFPITLGTHEHWAYPVIVSGRLYVRHGDTLMAFDVQKK